VASGLRLRPRPEVRDRVVVTPEAAGNAVALLLAEPRRKHRQSQIHPQPRIDKIILWLSGPPRSRYGLQRGHPRVSLHG
jgi:hypothetical protein